jgi:hypothetical protein
MVEQKELTEEEREEERDAEMATTLTARGWLCIPPADATEMWVRWRTSAARELARRELERRRQKTGGK